MSWLKFWVLLGAKEPQLLTQDSIECTDRHFAMEGIVTLYFRKIALKAPSDFIKAIPRSYSSANFWLDGSFLGNAR